MERFMYFAVPLLISSGIFTFFSNRYAWQYILLNKLLSRVSSRSMKVLLWIISATIIQSGIQIIFEHNGMNEPVLRIPVSISFGYWISLLPVFLNVPAKE